MNDPNGPIEFDGWTHLFYLNDPYSSRSRSGDASYKAWGHARTRNLVDWEYLPLALAPSAELGEVSCRSGACAVDPSGSPIIVYTHNPGPGHNHEIWAARPDDSELIDWRKIAENPIITMAHHGGLVYRRWRDPAVFFVDRQAYALAAGGLDGRGSVALYRSENVSLTQWSYVGVLFTHPNESLDMVECPNIVCLSGDVWALMLSVHLAEGRDRRVHCFLGSLDLDNPAFNAINCTTLGEDAYASALLNKSDGRSIQFIWMPTGFENRAWNGYFTLPTSISLAADRVSVLRQPIEELKVLRTRRACLENELLSGCIALSERFGLDSAGYEVLVDIESGSAEQIGLRVRCSADGLRGYEIVYDAFAGTISMPCLASFNIPANKGRFQMRIFVDAMAIELFADRGTITKSSMAADTQPGDNGLEVFSIGGDAIIHQIEIYIMRPAKFEFHPSF